MNIFIDLSFFLIFFNCIVNCVILETKQGALEGEILSSRDGRPYYAFYSIPYAEPPVGELRFQNPVPAKSWQGIRDATVLPPLCLHWENFGDFVVGEEDCLYLNVYTPKIGNNTLLPVMVFIYGGRFMFGNALPSKYGPQYFMDEDVVLITFHYRLASLGFLSTGDEVIPGNYGLKDAIAVLQWVQRYIDAYGGDKNRVTVFGGSSGGATAALILISPLAKGLVHRVISQSGHSSNFDMTENPRSNAWKFASFVGCNDDNITTSETLLKCLRKLPAVEIVKQNLRFLYLGDTLPLTPWSPVIENEKAPGAFLVDEPRKLLARKSDIPWIIGMNSEDGGIFAIFIYYRSDPSVFEDFVQNYKKYLPIMFSYSNAGSSQEIDQLTEIYKNHYFGDTSIRENVHAFSKMSTYLRYLSGLKEILKLYQGPTYFYYYGHRNKETFGSTLYGKYDGDMGVVHGDELISMYNWSETITPVTEGIDLVVSKQMVKLWVNFAATGDPNGDGKKIWRPVDSPDINYLHIKDGVFETKEALLKSEFEFLESVCIEGHCYG